METRLREELKKSKQAKADRIVNSLKMKSSMLSPVTRKIKKKRRGRQQPLNYLTYETQNGRKKKVCFIFKRTSRKNSGPKHSSLRNTEIPVPVKKKASIVPSQGGYGDLLFSVYENLKKQSESAPKNLDKPSTDDKSHGKVVTDEKDNFASIEYDPIDNYFYLIGNNPADKMALFENQGMKHRKMVLHNFVINPVLLKNLKKDFQLEGLFS